MANERRRKQIARRIQAKLAQLLLYEMKDPRSSFITITEVDINADLTVARVYWSAFDASSRSKTAALLKHAAGFLRTEVAQDIQLRNAPQLVFQFDERLGQADRIEAILREVLPGDAASPAPADSEAAEDLDSADD
jgi:ribosome-binding factor A